MPDDEGTMFFVLRLPHPWPPPQQLLLCGGNANNKHLEVWALPDSKLSLSITPPPQSFVSQPIDVNSSTPRRAMVVVDWTPLAVSVHLSGQTLLADSQDVPTLVLPAQVEVLPELSLNDPNSVVACQTWIQNRAAKFANPSSPRTGRRLKTVEEQAVDLHNSAILLKDFQQQIMCGKHYLLGHLAGEMRASVYWPKGSDAQPPVKYDPLLLRMANMGGLPLPVYAVPKSGIAPSILDDAVMRHEGANAPRLERAYPADQVCDLQESLIRTVLRVGQVPGTTITGLELIAALANTMGGSHYDKDASEFLDVLNNMTTSEGTQALSFMCHTAEALASLSQWVLSELKTRSIIG